MSEEIVTSVSQQELTTSSANDVTKSADDVMKRKRRIMKNLIVVSGAFLFLFTAFQALQNLQSSRHSDPRLGLVSLSVIYASLVISCMFVPPILINRLGCKRTIALSICGYVVFFVANFYPKWWTLVPTSILLGISGAPLWAAKCAYVTSSGLEYSQLSGELSDAVITRFFGIFFLIFQSGQIWGNLISSLVLKPKGNSTILQYDASAVCGGNYCPGILKDAENVSIPEESTGNTLMGIYLACGLLAIVITLTLLDGISVTGSEKKQTGLCSLFLATLGHCRDRKMQLLIPLTVFSGLEQGFVFGDFTKSFVTCTLGIEQVGFVMICFGAVDAALSLTLGKVVEYTGRPAMMISGAIINLALLILFLTWRPSAASSYVFYVGAALWGFSDAIWQTQVNAFYGVLFPTNQEAAFSNYRLWESLGFVISFAYSGFLCVSVKLYILIIVLVVSISLYLVIEVLRRRELLVQATLNVDYHISMSDVDKRNETL